MNNFNIFNVFLWFQILNFVKSTFDKSDEGTCEKSSCDGGSRKPTFITPLGSTYVVHSGKEIRDLQQAGKVKPGDAIQLANGIWKNEHIVISVSGANRKGKHIFVVPQTPGEVHFQGKSYIRITGNYTEVRGLSFEGASWEKACPLQFGKRTHHNRITNCLVKGFNRNDSPSIRHHWVDIWGSHHILDWNAFEEKGGTFGDIVHINGDVSNTKDSWGHRIANNFFGERPFLGPDGAKAIQIGFRNTQQKLDVMIENNVFYNYDGETEIIAVRASNNTIRFNTFIQSQGMISVQGGNKNIIQSNFFFCDSKKNSGGIRIWGNDHRILNNYIEGEYSASVSRGSIILHSGSTPGNSGEKTRTQRSIVAFNTLAKCRRCLIIGEGGKAFPRNNTVSNNIIWGYDHLSTLIDIEDGAVGKGHKTLFESNVISNGYSVAGRPGVREVSLELERHLLHHYYVPTTGSTTIHRQATGEHANVVEDDISGRWRQKPTDIGAAIYSDDMKTLPPRRPLQPSDVGPTWYSPTLINPEENWEQFDFSHYRDLNLENTEKLRIPKVNVGDGKVVDKTDKNGIKLNIKQK